MPPPPRRRVGAAAGEGEEDLVEAGQVQRELGDGDAGGVEPARRRRASAVVAGDGHADRAAARRRPARRRRSRRGSRATSSSRVGSAGRTVSVWPPTIALEPVGRVVGDDPAVVDDRDLVGQRVGLLEVLRGQQDGRAVGDERCARRPTCPRAWPGRGRWSARRGRSPPGGRRGSRRGRAGGACRRSRSWRAGRRRRSGRTRRAAPAARACAPRARRGRAAGRSARGSGVPVRSSSTDAYWPVRPIVLADLARRRAATS